MPDVLATIVEPGAIEEIKVGAEIALLIYGDGRTRFRHRCDRGRRGVVICSPELDPAHAVARDPDGAITVTPSILCDDCGTHGFVTDSVWRDC